MEVFYGNSEKLQEEEIQNIANLLSSAEVTNIELGLTLLQHYPKAVKEVAIPLILIYKFRQGELKQKAQILLHSYLPSQIFHNLLLPLQVFDPVDAQTLTWIHYSKRLQIFEQNKWQYEPYILADKHYLKWYLQIAKICILEYTQWAMAMPYLNCLLNCETSDLEARLYWIDAYLFYYFPKDLHHDKAEEVIKSIQTIALHATHIAPLAAYRLGLVYELVHKDNRMIIHYYQQALDLGLKGESYKKVALKLVQTYIQIEDYEKANNLLQSLEKQFGVEPILYELAIVAWKAYKNYQVAINLLKRILAKNKTIVQPCLDLVNIYKEIDDTINANFYQQQAKQRGA